MNIALVTPAGSGSRAGNRHTALRWAGFLRKAGHAVSVMQQWRPDPRTELLLALHARRSHDSIRLFAQTHPGRPLILALTGTDIYRDLDHSAEARESLRLASRFIVLQREALSRLPKSRRSLAHVVIQSSSTLLRHRPVKRGFRVSVIGHLREEKDPLRALHALDHVPRDLAIEVLQVGASLDPRLERGSRPGYRRVGGVPHARALAYLASSHAMVISSRMEGGANVVSEAIRIGVPVLASRIPGNVGLLGRGYPAYFPVGNERALARLMTRAATDAGFYRQLKRCIATLRPLVAPASESRMLLAALRG
ncbi:MAG: selenoneine biosynthesis selenosugar synthase SenB [Bradyrhizobium sp.]|uniref:selenoneine biosynthesis selenosugar synthase SenB n=1 Tax=Bradyrhizobium sp. TaxID=376 RepID=UPI003D11C823